MDRLDAKHAQKAEDGMVFQPGDWFLCSGCGTQKTQISGWATAHYDEGFVYTCPGCGTKTTFESGEVVRIVKAGED